MERGRTRRWLAMWSWSLWSPVWHNYEEGRMDVQHMLSRVNLHAATEYVLHNFFHLQTASCDDRWPSQLHRLVHNDSTSLCCIPPRCEELVLVTSLITC